MPTRKPMPTYSELEKRVAELERQLSQAFSVEEMDVLREQLTEKVARAEAAHEALEWRLRTELQRVRDAEDRCNTASREMRRVATSISLLLEDEDDSTEIRAPRMLQ